MEAVRSAGRSAGGGAVGITGEPAVLAGLECLWWQGAL